MVVEVDRGATGACGRPSQFCARCAAPSPLQPAGLKIVSRARGGRELPAGPARRAAAVVGRAARLGGGLRGAGNRPRAARPGARSPRRASGAATSARSSRRSSDFIKTFSLFQPLRCWHEAHHGCPSLPPPAGASPRPRRGRARRGAPFRSRARVGRSRAASTHLARRDTAATQASSSCTTARATPGGRRRPPATSGRASST